MLTFDILSILEMPRISFHYANMIIKKVQPTNLKCKEIISYQDLYTLNKRAQRALGRSPEEKVKGHSGAI